MNPEHPVYVISKGRHESRPTSKALEKRGISYRIVVEPQEYALYAAVIDPRKVLTLPFSNLGQGSIPARNWVWEHSLAGGHARHWILDDNIIRFEYLNRNLKYHTTSGTTFRAIERFADRYENLALCGMQYDFFAPRRKKCPPADPQHSRLFVHPDRQRPAVPLARPLQRGYGPVAEGTQGRLVYCTV
jgi:hypothetical protein